MGQLTPKLETLPKGQQQIWPVLSSTPRDFVLYGGTALALRLGHRDSIDFDFFSNRPFQPMQLLRSVSYLEDQVARQESENTLFCDIATRHGAVKISFFGGLKLGQISAPDVACDNAILVASLIDIFGMKCATVMQRTEAKDYEDVHALITIGKITLTEGIAAAKAIYGQQYNPVFTLQALTYFDDLAKPLPERMRVDLLAAVKSVSLEKIPTLTATLKNRRKESRHMTKTLEDVARGVNWYTKPEDLLADADRFLCQVMARGLADEIVTTQQYFTPEQFKKAYRAAPPGLFTKRAWSYWGLMLFDDPTMTMPERFPGTGKFDWRKAT